MEKAAKRKRLPRGSFSKQKGKRGERQIVKMLQGAIEEVYQWLEQQPRYESIKTLIEGQPQLKRPFLERNQNQTNAGGCDLVGIKWASIEIKNTAKCSPALITKWWQQCLDQCEENEEPILFFKRGTTQRVMVKGVIGGNIIHHRVPVEICIEDFMMYFRNKVHAEFQTSN